MKKVLLGIVILLILAVGAVLLFIGSIAGSAVKSAINTYGPKLTGTPVAVSSVSVKPYIGSAAIYGLEVGNPEGFKAKDAFKFEEVSIDLSPMSLLSDKVEIKSIRIIKPYFSYEQQLSGSNINKLKDNIDSNTVKTEKAAEESSEASGESQRKFIVHEVYVTGGKVAVGILNQSATVDLPEIHLTSVSEEGITAAQISDKILTDILEKVAVMAPELAAHIAKDPVGTAQGIVDEAISGGNEVGQEVSNAVKGLFGGDKDK